MTATNLRAASFASPGHGESTRRAPWLGQPKVPDLLSLYRRLCRPVDIASLAAFRFLFGLLMAGAMLRFLAKGWVRQLYIEPAFFFSYPGFAWVRPWPGPLMYAHFALLAVLALGIALGCFYRVCTALFFVGFTYVELLDQTNYLNHYYLISVLSGLMLLLPSHRAWSIDAWRRPELRADVAPGWCLNLLRFQVAVVYLFAGLAKFNADWLLHAQPLRIWLAARSDLPGIGPWLGQLWIAYGASWFGAVFDTSIVFFLLYKPTRRPGYALLLLFHVATWALFNIGIFPWLMIVAATLLFPPDWPRHWIRRVLRRKVDSTDAEPTIPHRRRADCSPRHGDLQAGPTQSPDLQPMCDLGVSCDGPHPLLLLFLGAYAAIQLALPLRPYFSQQPSAWTCCGFNCAWRVMIAEKTGYAEFYASDPTTGRKRRLSVKNYLTPRQEMMMAQDPYLIRAMARRLAADQSRQSGVPLQVTVNAFATLNGRASQRLIDPTVDLAGPLCSRWILPLKQ